MDASPRASSVVVVLPSPSLRCPSQNPTADGDCHRTAPSMGNLGHQRFSGSARVRTYSTAHLGRRGHRDRGRRGHHQPHGKATGLPVVQVIEGVGSAPDPLVNVTMLKDQGQVAQRREDRREDPKGTTSTTTRHNDPHGLQHKRSLHATTPHQSSTSSRPWRNLPIGENPHFHNTLPTPREPTHPPPQHVRDTHNASQASEARVLSMCRITWRSLLCMSDEGPCQDLNATVSSPLNDTQIQNIQATVEDMNAADRVRFLTSFMRFLLELAHQVGVTLSADLHNDVDGSNGGFDATIMMQKPGMELRPTRTDATLLQSEIEALHRHRHQKIQSLLREIHAGYGRDLHTIGSEDAQNILAMLVVFRDEPTGDFSELPDLEDTEWAQRWFRCLQGLFHLPSTSSSSTAPMTCVTVDTPPSSLAAAPAETAEESMQKAARLQREEDRIMAEALSTPSQKSRRLLLNVSIAVGDESSFSRLSVRLPETTTPIEMRLTLTATEPNEGMDTQNDGVSLMQTGRPGTRTLLDSLRPEVRRQVNRQIRRILMTRLQRLLRECNMLMREQQDLLAMASTKDCSEENAPTATEQDHDLAHLYATNLHNQLQQLLDEDIDVDPYDIVMQLAQGLDPQWPGRRHRLLPMEPEPASNQIGTEEEARALAQRIMEETDALLHSKLGQGRADLLRDFVATLVGGLQTTGARLMTLLLLVGHYLPQPFAEAQASSQIRALGRNYGRDILHTVERSFATNIAEILADQAFGIDEVAPLVPILSTMSLQCMTFLENASFLLANQSSASSHDSPLLLPDYMMPGVHNPHGANTTHVVPGDVTGDVTAVEGLQHEGTARFPPTRTCTPRTSRTTTRPSTSPTRTTRTRSTRGTSSTTPSATSSLTSPTTGTFPTPPGTMPTTGNVPPLLGHHQEPQRHTTPRGTSSHSGDMGIARTRTSTTNTSSRNSTTTGDGREVAALGEEAGGPMHTPLPPSTSTGSAKKKRKSSPVPAEKGIRRFMSES